MCIFAGPRSAQLQVAGTQIFARVARDRQCIVYSMHLRSDDDVAMILPVPVVPGSGDEALELLDFSGYPTVFEDLGTLFVERAAGSEVPLVRAAPQAKLVVHEVGAFDASYVPSLADFERLDARFRLPATIWSRLPQYSDYGFAVFQLRRGDAKVHPMAFQFPTRDPSRVFFPTVHVHDGALRSTAEFHHELFWQGPQRGDTSDRESSRAMPATTPSRSKGLVLAEPVRRRAMGGIHRNDDVWIG